MTAAPSARARLTSPLHWAAVVVLCGTVIGTQVALDGAFTTFTPARRVQWVQSTALMRRLALGFDALAADIYWIRAVQYYGDTRISTAEGKNFDLLYPLLDMTTSLDPAFKIAYRFGAVLLSEAYPNGPGQADQAIALLEKGIRQTPDRWEYYHDAGFVEFWWRQDYEAASSWLLEASKMPKAPNWLPAVSANMLVYGGARGSARALWSQLAATAEQDWMRKTARRALLQLDAEVAVEQLQAIANRFYDKAGRFPSDWSEVVRAGLIRGVPLDPTGEPYTVDPVSGAVDVGRESELYPLRRSGPLSGPTQ